MDRTLKSIRTAERLALFMIETLLNVITKLKLFSSAILNKRIIFIKISMKVDPLCLPIFNDAKECLFQGKNK